MEIKKIFKQITYIYKRYIHNTLLFLLDIAMLLLSIALIDGGYTAIGIIGILIVIGLNAYYIWKARSFISNMWVYINYIVDKQIAKEKRLKKKNKSL